jgi:hypothetical protein
MVVELDRQLGRTADHQPSMTDFADIGRDRRPSEGAHLLSVLEDPFNTFPLGSVARDLTGLVDKSESRRADRSGWWGVPPAFLSVDDEHDIAFSGVLIGAAFVLAQGTIEESVSIVNKLGSSTRPPPGFHEKSGQSCASSLGCMPLRASPTSRSSMRSPTTRNIIASGLQTGSIRLEASARQLMQF